MRLCVSANRDYSPCKFVSPPSRPTLTCVEYGLFLCLFCTQLSNRETYCTHPKSPTVQVCAAGAGGRRWGGDDWDLSCFSSAGRRIDDEGDFLAPGSSRIRLLVRPVQHTSSLLVRPTRILTDWTLVHLWIWAHVHKNSRNIYIPSTSYKITGGRTYGCAYLMRMRMGWTFSNRNLFILPRIVL